MLSSSGRASGLWLKHSPDSADLVLPNWVFRIAFRCRFALPLFAEGASCCLCTADVERQRCGKPLYQDGVHATTCKFGGGVAQFHDCVKHVAWQACKAAGHLAYKEQVVPQWGKWVAARRPRRRQGGRHSSTANGSDEGAQHYVEAILDVVSFDPGSLQFLYIDATVRNAVGQRYLDPVSGSAVSPGYALAFATDEKRKRYPDSDGLHVITAGMEQHGRIADEFLSFLEVLQGQAGSNDEAHCRPACHWLKKWLRQLSSGLALAQQNPAVPQPLTQKTPASRPSFLGRFYLSSDMNNQVRQTYPEQNAHAVCNPI